MSTNKTVDIFGDNVFNDKAMENCLPKDALEAIRKTTKDGVPLSDLHANIVADALKVWAINKGATHYTHWFQPLTGITAEKHESFLSPNQQGNIITKFRGKELIKGEPDASSFPNGGMRATFEARGYTAWDPTSFAFIKDKTLCIPTVFCSYSGELLDKKTPLLNSNTALNKQCMRILKLFNSDASSVSPTVGAEQEYFLIDKKMYLKRHDLMYCGRTLLGAKPPKGQELDDHYFGSLKPRVRAFMEELDYELALLGIISKTEHNEVAPAQHELAPSYTNANIACDHNQLIMELLKKIADRHNMTCLLHEKPFGCINGSGKHNNWSMLTDTDINLLEPGNNPRENAQFLLFLSAIIKAVDQYQDLLRATVATAGNDHRLGASEAPPAIISIFIGSDLEEVIDNITSGTAIKRQGEIKMKIGVDSLPEIPQDTTDRNRTSPLAFTGNKFEFRMPGASSSVADPITVINTIVAESLLQFADILENVSDFDTQLNKLITDTLTQHRRIIFNGDGYSSNWVAEAERRGLYNLTNAVASLEMLTKQKNIDVLVRHGVLTEREILARHNVLLENYNKIINIEANTLLEMMYRDILPCTQKYIGQLCSIACDKNKLGLSIHKDLTAINVLVGLFDKVSEDIRLLQQLLDTSPNLDQSQMAKFNNTNIVDLMSAIRSTTDELECITPRSMWPIPTYGDILYSVN